MTSVTGRSPKYAQIYEALRDRIQAGQLEPGARLPSEAALVEEFGASRITVGRAVRDLQQAGLVVRRIGSGTYVRARVEVPAAVVGVLVPDAPDTDVFAPMVDGLHDAVRAHGARVLDAPEMDSGMPRADLALKAAHVFVRERVSGVVFAPLESLVDAPHWNQRILRLFDEARVPVVLLDRSAFPYPARGPYDVVGVDNRRAAYAVTQHVVDQGARRVAFCAHRFAAPTVQARRAGYREALDTAGIAASADLDVELHPAALDDVARMYERARPDACVCANDRVAADLLASLRVLGIDVPADVLVSGFDDAACAARLPVSLTTVRQPGRQIGEAAATALLERLAMPQRPARDIFLRTKLVVRRSTQRIVPSAG